MSQSNRAPITAGLIARKGAATTSSAVEPLPTPAPPAANDAPPVSQAKPPKPTKSEPDVPLNFAIPASFKKRFAMAALNEDLTHKNFLIALFEQYERHGLKRD